MTDPAAAAKPIRFHAFKTSPDDRWGSLDSIAEAVVYAEELGFHAVNLPQHIILPAHGGGMPQLYYDKVVLTAYLAALTHRIRFFLYALIVPYHPPIQMAKSLATLDHVTGGRLAVATGVGWLQPEFEMLGVPFSERGQLTDEHLAVMLALWTQDEPSHRSENVAFHQASFFPKCFQAPHVPLWIGGSGPAARRRAVALGQGWIPMAGSLTQVRAEAEEIRARLEEAGRDPSDFEFAYKLQITDAAPKGWHPDLAHHGAGAGPPPTCRRDANAVGEAITDLRDAGFTNISLYFDWHEPSGLMRDLEWFAETVLPEFTP